MAKKTKRPHLPKDIEVKCNRIIHGASVAAGTAGAAGAQLPVADNAVITPIQIGMIIALAKVFDRNLTKEAAFGVLKGAGAAFIGRGVSQVLVGWVPGLGNAINTATAAGLTEAVGWMSAGQFYDEWLKEGHTPDDIPSSFDENIKEADNAATSSEYADYDQDIEGLMVKADEFIEGKKDAKKADKEEFYQLLEEIEAVLVEVPEDDPLRIKHAQLVECMK